MYTNHSLVCVLLLSLWTESEGLFGVMVGTLAWQANSLVYIDLSIAHMHRRGSPWVQIPCGYYNRWQLCLFLFSDRGKTKSPCPVLGSTTLGGLHNPSLALLLLTQLLSSMPEKVTGPPCLTCWKQKEFIRYTIQGFLIST